MGQRTPHSTWHSTTKSGCNDVDSIRIIQLHIGLPVERPMSPKGFSGTWNHYRKIIPARGPKQCRGSKETMYHNVDDGVDDDDDGDDATGVGAVIGYGPTSDFSR